MTDKVRQSIERLKAFEPEDGYLLAFSGGKDSVVIKALADMAGVNYHARYTVTSVDPPELVQFVKAQKDVEMFFPRDVEGKRITMWSLIERKGMLPTRLARYCCASLKESQNGGKTTITGVRWAESTNRAESAGIIWAKNEAKAAELIEVGFEPTRRGSVLRNDNVDKRRVMEICSLRNDITVNPIVDWDDDDVWGFIHREGVPYCGLYDEGFSRLGCIGCPMAGRKGRLKEFARWPRYVTLYKHAIARMLDERERKGLKRIWDSVDDAWNWWIEEPVGRGQMTLGLEAEYDTLPTD